MSIVCPHCGGSAEPGDRFCGTCGKSMARATPERPASQAVRKTRRRSGWKVGGVIGLAAVLAVALAWFGGYLPSSTPARDDSRSTTGAVEVIGNLPDTETAAEDTPADATPAFPSESDEAREAREVPSPSIPEGEPPAAGTTRSQEPVPLPGGAIETARPVLFAINSQPEGARLFVDGEYRGTTPILVGLEPARVHEIRLELAGHEDVLVPLDPRDFAVGQPGVEDVVSLTIPIEPTTIRARGSGSF